MGRVLNFPLFCAGKQAIDRRRRRCFRQNFVVPAAQTPGEGWPCIRRFNPPGGLPQPLFFCYALSRSDAFGCRQDLSQSPCRFHLSDTTRQPRISREGPPCRSHGGPSAVCAMVTCVLVAIERDAQPSPSVPPALPAVSFLPPAASSTARPGSAGKSPGRTRYRLRPGMASGFMVSCRA